MKSTLSFFVFFVFSVLVISSCKKGDTGPAGTANVMFSDWFKPDAFVKDTVFGIWGFKYNKAAAGLTKNVLDSGTVMVYGKLLGYNQAIWPATQVEELPISLTYVQGSTMTDTWTAQLTEGNLRIRFVNDKNYYTSISTAHMFRYIIIPGAVKTGRSIHLSYEEICRQYNIPE